MPFGDPPPLLEVGTLLGSLSDFQASPMGQGVTAADETVTFALAAASEVARTISRQTITLVTGDPVWVDGRGADTLFLPELPVQDVTSVVVDGTTLTVGVDYEVNEELGILRTPAPVPAGAASATSVQQVWPRGAKRILVTYSHGYPTIPSSVQSVVYGIARRMVDQRGGQVVAAEALGGWSATYAGLAQAGVTDLELSILEGLRP